MGISCYAHTLMDRLQAPTVTDDCSHMQMLLCMWLGTRGAVDFHLQVCAWCKLQVEPSPFVTTAFHANKLNRSHGLKIPLFWHRNRCVERV